MDPEDPLPAASASRIVSDVNAATIDALLDSAGPGSPSQLASVELRSLGGALARRARGAGARATLARRLPDVRRRRRDEPGAHGRGPGPGRRRRRGARARGTRALRYANFEEAQRTPALFYDEDTFRLLRALRTEWDPSGLFLANHEIKD